ncbi:bifunctional diaminohydroxyphosphoribosylaminopyrimidine deaminase/5-amino-6-(5-phosphoribosylamino)uracil reductase RibD [Christiangramia aquimixticola]|uniref:bifunctional diaminohydroxyphosphoribosylaminopyrimidine deaminase/5-amino-6-(5-phosphoribosylamino)uracil reductase RibD n=1 Tax=Christiangramia aquimixticola TaxID=1697558 RepID=UPI003AA96CEB
MKIHEKYINRCIQLAQNGLGTTYPNPLVGSVVVHNNMIIGEGWHQQAGKAHAEVNAINSVKNKDLLKDATIYVSLEPCSHYGKTPPCSDLIIAHGIKKVVIGSIDPFAKVAGRGIKKLMDAGCEVRVGVLEKQCRELNERFFTFHTEMRPYIILKWAQTGDNFIAPINQPNARPVWITNRFSGQLVHKWRSEESGILVGTNTALKDNPSLTVRKWTGNHPVRLVLDRELKISKEFSLYDNTVKTIIITEKKTEEGSGNTIFEQIDFSQDLVKAITEICYKYEIQSLIVEGGRYTLQQFIDSGTWDEARIFTGNKRFEKGIPAPELIGTLNKQYSIQGDMLEIFENSHLLNNKKKL